MSVLQGRRIVLGVTGSIAAYKAAELTSALVQEGALVDVVLTAAAQRFVSALTFQSLTMRAVFTDMFDFTPELSSAHVALGERADLVAVVPASATTIARLTMGSAEDLIASTVLATRAPVVLAPAMESKMYQHPATQANLEALRRRGVVLVDPEFGRLASGHSGIGRLAPLPAIIGTLRQTLGRGGPLADRRVVVTAGGTQEPLDPVRYVGNWSSGKMGYALAEAARDRGATVTLIAGPTAVPDPVGVDLVHVTTAAELREAVLAACQGADALIMAAAVADYRPSEVAQQKIKKTGPELTLRLVATPDFSGEVATRSDPRLVKVYFAAETENLLSNAEKKLGRLQADLVVANNVAEAGSGFGSDTNRVTLLGRGTQPQELPLLPKAEVAERILDEVQELLADRQQSPPGRSRRKSQAVANEPAEAGSLLH